LVITPLNTTISQYKFSLTEPSKYKHPLILGGFGSGKTRSIPLRWMYLIEWRNKHQKIKCKIMIVEPTTEMIRDILVSPLQHYYHRSAKNYDIYYRGYKFTAMFRSSDNPASLTGKSVTDIIIDEFDKTKSIKDQRDIWTESIARIRQAEYGTVGVVTTPEGFKYTYELWGDCEHREKENFTLIRAKTYENQFLPKDYIQNLYNQYSKELVEQYIEARFINISLGKAYSNFNRNRHIRKLAIDYTLPLYFTFDFNINPMSTSICQIRTGQLKEQQQVIQVVKVINTRNSTAEKQCIVLKDYLKEIQFNGTLIITGDATKVHTVTSNLTNWEIVKHHFPTAIFRLRESNPAVIDRVNSVNSKLLNSYGNVGIYINEVDCNPLIKDLEQVSWVEGKSDIDKKNPELTHNSDNLGYLVWNEFAFIQPNIAKIGRYA
jgi:hypothetical protein